MVYVRHLLFDNFNVRHLKKHDITIREVIAVCEGKHFTLPSYGGRLLLIGAIKGRVLSVVVAPKPKEGKNVYYPVSARPASRKERKGYFQRNPKSKEVKQNEPK